MPLVRNYNVMVNGIVKTRTEKALLKSKETVFQVIGDIMAYNPLDALRSTMLINDYVSIEQAYIGQFDSDGKYALFQYNEVVRYRDDFVDCKQVGLVYLSEIAYKDDFFISPEKRLDMYYQSLEHYWREIN